VSQKTILDIFTVIGQPLSIFVSLGIPVSYKMTKSYKDALFFTNCANCKTNGKQHLPLFMLTEM